MLQSAIGIIADDLTGAMDSSGHLAARGLDTFVILENISQWVGDVIAVSTESRLDDAAVASEKARRVAKELKGKVIYKKMDSTLRGNVGPELAAVIKELECDKTIVAPAFPAAGRTTVDGILYLNGIPVSQTRFAHDPICPVTESYIPRLLEQSMGYPVGLVTLNTVAAGPESIYHEIISRTESILVCDAVEQSHLHSIACASALTKDRWLLCGSGGLARELYLLLTKVPKKTTAVRRSFAFGLALILAGSPQQVTASQLRRTQEKLGLPIVNLEVGNLGSKKANSHEVMRIIRETSHFLNKGKSVAITSAFSPYVPSLKETVSATMCDSVTGILAIHRLAGLLLCGGDIAIRVCQRILACAIRVYGEAAVGLPGGEIIGGEAQGIRVITKAGDFGGENAMIDSISYLERGLLSDRG